MAANRIAEAYVQLIVTFQGVAEQIEEGILDGVARAQEEVDPIEVPVDDEKISEDIDAGSKKGGGKMAAALMAAVAAAGIANLIGDAIANGLQQQKTDNKLAATLGLDDPAELKTVQDSVRGIYEDGFGAAYEDVASTMNSIVSTIEGASSMSQEELEAMGKSVMGVSDAWGVSAEGILKASNSAINNGLAKNFEEAQGLIIYGFQQLGESGEDWMESMNEFSGDFKAWGFEGAAAVDLVRAGIEAGIKDTDIMADALNELTIKLNDGTSGEALMTLGLDPSSIKAQVQEGGAAAQAAFIEILNGIQASGGNGEALGAAIFGTRFEDYSEAFMDLDTSKLTTGMVDLNSQAQEFNSLMGEGATTSLSSFQRAFEGAMTAAVMPILEAVTPMLQEMATWLTENEEAATLLAIAVGGVMLLSVVTMTAALWSMAAAGWAAMAPFLPFIAVIAAIGLAIYGLVFHFEEIALGFKIMGNGIISFINFIIMGINWLIDALNNLSVDMPDWAGGQTLGFNIGNIPEIPLMADGGTIKAKPGGTLAILGEAGRDETVVDSGLMNSLMAQVLSGGGISGGGNHIEITVVQREGESGIELAQRIEEALEFNSLRGEIA